MLQRLPPATSDRQDPSATPDERRPLPPRTRLEALDRQVVPRLQRAARRLQARGGHVGDAVMRWEDRFAHGRPIAFGQRNARVLAPLVGLLLLVGAAIHMDRYPDLQSTNGGAQQITEAGGPPASGGQQLAGGETVEVGPRQGADIAVYIAARRDVLAGLPGDAQRVAVASFASTLDAGSIDALVDGLRVHSIQFLNPQAVARPLSTALRGTVAATIEAAVSSTRDLAREERDSAQALIDDGNVTDPRFLAEYQARVAEMQSLLDVLNNEPAIVFAVVLEGPVTELQRLAGDPAVRLVDVAPAEADVAQSGFWGLLPSDTARASFGRG